MKYLKEIIRTIPHWPKQGVMFRDITTLLKDPEAFGKSIDLLYERYKDKQIDVVAGIESRGFIFGGALAYKLNAGFVPLRKAGKLPAETKKAEYELEYGVDSLEIHTDSIKAYQNVLLVDDLLATGGTCSAATKLIEGLRGNIVEIAFLIDLPALEGKKKLQNYPIFSMMSFEGE